MKKKVLLTILSVLFLSCLAGAFAGCSVFSGTGRHDPYEAIKEAYGTQEFTISFHSDNLSEPLDDMSYTAYNMPSLPTPKRVGYVFDGWFFDEDCIKQCFDDSLYLYMCDVTLYAKWVKEELVQDGVYDIDVSLSVTEGSIIKNSLADKYGNSPEYFFEDVDSEAMQIEKSGDRILLKFVYSVRTAQTFGSNEMYLVAVDSERMGTSVRAAERIVPQSETGRVLYFDITDISLEDTIYFTVSAYKWNADVEEGENIDNTRITFTLEFKIEEFYGFTTAYADPDVELEDGYYSVKTYYDSEMMSPYDSVYSYIYAEDGHYTLIKPFTPYTGYLGEEFSTDYYYDIGTAMMPAQYYYCLSEDGAISAYKPTTIEFHADTGRYYFIFDLGTSVKQDILFTFVIGGPMQIIFHMGSSEMGMDIDYNSMIKVSDIGYEPLCGDSFRYEDSFSVVGSAGLTSGDHDFLMKYGASVPFINFFFSGNSLGDEDRQMFSHRITITPQNDTVSADQLSVEIFDMSVSIFGYDPSAGKNLYVNMFEDASLGGTALWGNQQVRRGFSLSAGDTVDLEEVFHEYAAPDGDFSAVKISAYHLNGSGVDFGNGYDLKGQTTFEFEGTDIAVLFAYDEYDGNGVVTGSNSTLVELRASAEPTVWFNGNFSYDTDKTVRTENERHLYASDAYGYGDTISYPDLNYNWYGQEGSFISNYLQDEELTIHPIFVQAYYLDEFDEYIPANVDINNDNLSFAMRYEHIAIVYELRNCYGEKYYVYTHFLTEEQEEYTILRNGESIAEGHVTYSGGVANEVEIDERYSVMLQSSEEVKKMLQDQYVFRTSKGDSAMQPVKAEVYTQLMVYEFENDIEDSVLFALNGAEYAVIVMSYSDGVNSYSIRYALGMRVAGESLFTAIPYDCAFTGRNYTLAIPQITSSSGLALGTGTLRVTREGENESEGFTLTNSGISYQLLFSETGRYTIEYAVSFRYAADGGRVFNRNGNYMNSTYIRLSQTVIVEDSQGTVTVTYVADPDHPFADPSIGERYTVTYSLTDVIYLLSDSNFISNDGATLYGWASDPRYTISDDAKLVGAGAAISDFIAQFNSNNVTLYAVWDEKITVTLSLMGVSGGESEILQSNIVSHTVSAEGGSYVVEMAEFLTYAENRVPSGYKLIGFIGGFFGDEVVSCENWTNLTSYRVYETGVSYEIFAVYAKTHTVRFDTGYGSCSDTFYGNASVSDGSALGANRAVTPYEGYRFVGWYVRGDESQTIVDISTYQITADITFVAKFEKTGE